MLMNDGMKTKYVLAFCKSFLKIDLNFDLTKKNLLFPEMRVTRKISTRVVANLFFYLIFWKYSLFFFSFFALFDSCFFFVAVVVLHIRLCEW